MSRFVLLAALWLAACRSDPAPRQADSSDLVVLAARPQAPSETVDWSRPLSLEECQALAEARSATAASFALRLAVARSALITAETWPNPLLDLQAQDLGRGSEALTQSTLGYPILFGWTQGAQEEVARATQQRTVSSVIDDRRRLRLEVARAYYELVAAEELASLEARSVTLVSELAELIERLVGGGERSPLDGRRARAETLEVRGVAERATRRRDVLRLAFSLALGADRPRPVQVVLGWPGDALVAQPNSGELVDGALERRADVAAAQAEVLRASAAVELEERRALPLSQLIATAGTRQGDDEIGGFFALRVPIPLFDRNQGARSRARADELNASRELSQARLRVAVEVETAWLGWERARDALETLRRPLVVEREALLEAVRRQVESGDAGPIELIQAQRDALAARRLLLEAELDVALEHSRLMAALALEPAERR